MVVEFCGDSNNNSEDVWDDDIEPSDNNPGSSAAGQIDVPSTGQNATTSGQGVTVPKTRLGLFAMSTHDDNNLQPGPDFIALHGIMGDYEETWTRELEDNTKVRWLREILPKKFPTARVYSYGYDAQVLFSKSKANIDDFAIGLLDVLKIKRTSTDAWKSAALEVRPIVFFCHSMGGIVVKKRLVGSNSNQVVEPHAATLGWPGEKRKPFMGCNHSTVCAFVGETD
ncbi:MAG: hypothetical protein Q9167_006697 [Letrouitia subvulpina]